MPIAGSIFKKPKADKAKGNDDIVGRFRSGYQANNRPVGLTKFRVTTEHEEDANAIVGLLGGKPAEQWDTKTSEVWEAFTDAESVDIIVEPGGVRASLVLWSNKGGKIMESNGEFLIEDGKVTAKPDPDAELPLAERKEKAKQGTGPEPSLQVYFRLAANPELGKLKFFSGSWTAADGFGEAEAILAQAEGPMNATLALEVVEFTAKDGTDVRYTKPVVTILGPVEEGF